MAQRKRKTAATAASADQPATPAGTQREKEPVTRRCYSRNEQNFQCDKQRGHAGPHTYAGGELTEAY